MQSHQDTNKDLYACQNCAKTFEPPHYREEPMVLLEDEGEYHWISRNDRKAMIPVEKCCDLPYIQELEN